MAHIFSHLFLFLHVFRLHISIDITSLWWYNSFKEVRFMVQQFLVKDYFDKGKPVKVGYYIEHREINMHSHEFWELSYVYESRGTHYYSDERVSPIKEGEFVFMSPGISHCITSPKQGKGAWVRVCNFLMSQEYVEELKQEYLSIKEIEEYALQGMISRNEPFCIHLRDQYGKIYNLLDTAAHEYKYFTDSSDKVLKYIALTVLIYVTRLYESGLKKEKVVETKNDVIDDLIKFIRSNFKSNLTLDYLSAYVHLSPAYLSRYFKKCTGINISDFITKTRIDRAKQILKTSNYSIQDISEFCGYKDMSNFQRVFKKNVGMSASQYRKNNV